MLLLISGGHSQFLEVRGVNKYKRLGTTIDDALGEAFDKTAKILGIDFPGGPQIEEYAKLGDENGFVLPKPDSKQERLQPFFCWTKDSCASCFQKN